MMAASNSEGVAGPAVLLVLAGPAGSGKTTLCERMVRETPGFSRVITTTTRPPRPGEIDGVHYHFFSPEQFAAKVAENAFLERALVHEKYWYGTLASSVLDPLSAGRSLIINVDVQGVANFRQAARANPLLARHMADVFIVVPREELKARMHQRAQDAVTEIEHRLNMAEKEMSEASKFAYQIQSHGRDEDFAALVAIWRQAQARAIAAQA